MDIAAHGGRGRRGRFPKGHRRSRLEAVCASWRCRIGENYIRKCFSKLRRKKKAKVKGRDMERI